MELKALVVPTIRPDTLFIPFHYGNRQAVNQLTNPAVDPTVKIPEYKACAAIIEPLPAALPSERRRAQEYVSPEDARAMFPYAVGETRSTPPGKAGAGGAA
jgi:assimilatory nitrate reductase catalytic subunit